MARKRTATKLHLLTVREVQTAIDGDHSDGGGLLLRVRGDSASWVLRFTSPTGRQREMGLGQAHRASAAQAGAALTASRDLAHKAREQLRQGVDPIDQRDLKRGAAYAQEVAKKAAVARDHWTLARCARDYHECVIERTRTEKHSAQWISSLENHLPAAVWHAPIATVTPPMLLKALQAATPHERARHPGDLAETLRRVRQRLDAVFEDAAFYGRCESNAAAAIKRKLHEALPRGQAGQLAALPYREVPAFMARLRAAPGTAVRCLEFALLTAARTSEAVFAEWSELDVEGGVWTVPAERMKGGEAHTVFLSAPALDLVKAQRGLDDRYLFPSPMKPDRALSNMAMLKVLDRLGMRERTTVHGLCRASFSTWANDTDAAKPDVIEACLAHREANLVRASYNRADFNRQRKALLAAWAGYLAAPESNVVPLRAA
jgi:integrase